MICTNPEVYIEHTRLTQISKPEPTSSITRWVYVGQQSVGQHPGHRQKAIDFLDERLLQRVADEG